MSNSPVSSQSCVSVGMEKVKGVRTIIITWEEKELT